MSDAIQPATFSALSLSESGSSTPDFEDLIVTCRIGPQHYALPIGVIREVVRISALLTLAGAPPFVCGLLNLRGHYIPVLDGRILTGEQAEYDLSKQIMIAGENEPELGLLVDEVLDVQSLKASQRTPMHGQFAASFLCDVIQMGDASFILFDLDALRALVPENTHMAANAATDS